MQGYAVDYGPNEVVCREGDASSDLYYLKEGRLLICTVQGTQVKAIARLEAGEFLGELSFFDGKLRASYMVTLERCQIITFPKAELTPLLPLWYQEIHKNLTKKVRLLDEVIHAHSLRKFSSEEHRPLTIEEQRQLYGVITHQNN